MMQSVVGVDLGTTNSALSWFDLGASGRAEQQTLPIPQLVAPGTIENRPVLPSFLYLPGPDEFARGALELPWDRSADAIVGEFARSHGLKVPGRLVASAKSWLSHPGVDRTSALLPWDAPPEVERVSPVEASARFLRHLKASWRHLYPDRPLGAQEIVLTVPASFDAAGRELTRRAAEEAGLENLILLEEPQAALYAWIESVGQGFRQRIRVGDVILVIDVGGGTTDFSLIAVSEQNGELDLVRIAVGDHILLGGDNMDLTLAHVLAQELQAAGKKLDPVQFRALTYGCREAKERLFADLALASAPISVASRGSALIGATVRTDLSQDALERLLIDGFMPRASITEAPRTERRAGLTRVALPYAQDPGITRHLAAFLARQARALRVSGDVPVALDGRSFVHPTAILFNGGVFKARPLKDRVIEIVNAWLEAEGGAPVQELGESDLDLAVARGAAYYGWVRHGHGIRIRGGTARAYYVGVESPMPAVPGFEPPVKAVCVAPFGMEEGTEAEVPPQEFALVVGEPTVFRFFASSVRREDRVGTVVDDVVGNEEFEEAAPIETILDGEQGNPVPVNLQAAVTEVGTLELRCLEKTGPGRWKLELNVRTGGEDERVSGRH